MMVYIFVHYLCVTLTMLNIILMNSHQNVNCYYKAMASCMGATGNCNRILFEIKTKEIKTKSTETGRSFFF